MSKRTQLLEAIVALPEELVDQALTYVQMLQNPIQITPGVCGGQARIRNTRIPPAGGDVKHSFTGVGFCVDDKYSGEHDITTHAQL